MKTSSVVRCRVIPSPFGDLALLWTAREATVRVTRVLIPSPKQTAAQGILDHAGAAEGKQPQVEELVSDIARYLSGKDVALPIDLLDATACSPFQWSVLMAVKSIPRGQVRTYGQIAQAVGCPNGARAVGNALAGNPFPIVLPCHRAVRADGSLGGYYGGSEMKRTLLETEGVTFDARGRVLLR